MIVSLDVAYHSQLLFNPVYKRERSLLGVEVIANFITDNGAVRIPTEFVLARLEPHQQLQLFYEKLSLIEQTRSFFLQNGIIAWLSINENIAAAILTGTALKKRVSELTFLEFAINESYDDLNAGKENVELIALRAIHPLMLMDYGAGMATSRAIYDGLFRRVVLDKYFINRQLTPESWDPFITAIVTQIGPCCETLILPGVDSDIARRHAVALGINAMQGSLWPPVLPENRDGLLVSQ